MVNKNIFIDEGQDSNKEDQNKKDCKKGGCFKLGAKHLVRFRNFSNYKIIVP